MDTLLHDLRYGVRMLLKTPAFTAVAVFVLALGIGANTAVFSVVDSVLLSPLPYDHPDRLVVVWENSSKIPDLDRMFVAYPNYLDWRERNRTFEEMACYLTAGANLSGTAEPVRVQVAYATAGLFPALGVAPALGRVYGPEDDRPGAARTVVLSHAVWRDRFGGDPDVVGSTVSLDAEPFTVLGVMPAGFAFPEQAPAVEMWVPLGLYADLAPFTARNNHPGSLVIGRLKPGVTPEQARADLDAVAAQLGEEYPETNGHTGIVFHSLTEEVVGDVRPILLVVFGAIGFVLLIACANVANLMLARASVRQREIAIRKALGASRGRVARQMLAESAVLGCAGGALGLLVAFWGVDVLRAVAPDDLPRLAEAGLDLRVLGFTAAAALVTSLVFGLVPAVQSSRLEVYEALKEGGRGVAGSLRRNRLRGFFVVVELALALTLLVGAGLTLKSFARVLGVDPGFDPEHVALATVALPSVGYETPEKQLAFFRELVERARALPGARSAAVVSGAPMLDGKWQSGLGAEDKPLPPGQLRPLTDIAIVSPDYFRAMGIPLLEGRDFADADSPESRPVAIVDEVAARRTWPGESPIGKRITFDNGADGRPVWREVVGVAGHVKAYALDAESRMQVYAPYTHLPRGGMTLMVRTDGDPGALLGAIRGAVTSIDRNQPVAPLDTMESAVSDSLARRRFSLLLICAFATAALALAAVGIYGVIAYLVAQRANEFGIRVALGARARDVLALVLKQGLALALVGVGAGVAASLAVSRLLSSLLFEVSPTDPTVFAAVALLLAGVALLACYVPARRATRVDPVAVLKGD